MERNIEYMQQIQEAFAHHSSLALCIVDLDASRVTSPSNSNHLSDILYQKALADEEHTQLRQRLSKIKKTSLVDIYPGLQVIIAPVKVFSEVRYFIWSGVLLEQGNRSYVKQYIQARMESPEDWNRALDEVQEITSEQKLQGLKSINSLAQIIEQILRSNAQMEKWQHIISGISQASELAQQSKSITELLQTYRQMNNELDFVGLALEEEDFCTIAQMIGRSEYNALLGHSFTMGEGFLGHALAMGEMGYWEDIKRDPRSSIFTKNNVHPQSLICYPIQNEQKVIGVLFAGSQDHPKIGQYMVEIGQVMANISSIYLSQQEVVGQWVTQQQRVNAVMEVCQLISRTRDIKKLAFVMVDMSLNISQAKFAAVSLFQCEGVEDQVRVVSRGLTMEQCEKYGKRLLLDYEPQNEQRQQAYQPVAAPHVRELEWGASVMEFPIVNEKMYGVLSIAMQENIEEQKAFFSSLSTIGALAIHLASQAESETNKMVKQLYQASKYWDEEAYTFTGELQECVTKFIDFLELPTLSGNDIANAGYLIYYPASFIIENLPQAENISRIIEDYHQLVAGKGKGKNRNEQEEYSLGGKVLALISSHLKSKDKNKKSSIDVDADLQEKFSSFLVNKDMLDQSITLKEEVQLELEQLSKREQEVAHLLMQGMHNKEIAYELFISEHTVKNHITSIYNKLGVSDRPSLMAYFYHQKK